MSQQALATHLGISINSIARYEQPTRRPSINLLTRLWQIADVEATNNPEATDAATVFRLAVESQVGAEALSVVRVIREHMIHALNELITIDKDDIQQINKPYIEECLRNINIDLMEGLRLLQKVNPFPAGPTTDDVIGGTQDA